MSDQNFTIRKGDRVEVTSKEKGFEGSWFMATVVEPPPKSRTSKTRALVMYDDFIDDGGVQLCEFADTAYIRPVPEVLDVGGFQVNDVVEAKYNDGWWVGVVTKSLECSRYQVYLESSFEFLEFDAKDLRLHRLWVNGKWVRPEKQDGIAYTKDKTVKGEGFRLREYATSQRMKNKKLKVSANTNEHPYFPKETRTTTTNSLASSQSPTGSLFRQPEEIDLSTPAGKVGLFGSFAVGECSSYQNMTDSPLRLHYRESGEQGASIVLELEFVTVKEEADVVEIDATQEPISMELEAIEVQDTYQHKETQINESNSSNGLQVDIAHANVCDNADDDPQEENHEFVDEEAYQLNKVGIGCSDHLRLEHLADNDQQPLSGAVESDLSRGDNLVNASGTVKEVDKMLVKQIGQENEAIISNTLFDDQLTWPFVKNSPAWEMVENFEVFKVTLQRPHFSPLNETKEVLREGCAIGLIVTFSSVHETIYNLEYDHPNKKFEEILESLDELQTHGFDVVSMRARVNFLMSLKADYELLLSQVEEAEKEKLMKLSEREKYVEELQELETKRAELEKQFVDSMSKKEEKDTEVDRLQSYVDTINEKIQRARYAFTFERVAR